MALPMFTLTAECRGAAIAIDFNDVRLVSRADGVPARVAVRLNPWLMHGKNSLALHVSRPKVQIGTTKPRVSDPEAEGLTMCSFEITRGEAGSTEQEVLFQRELDFAQFPGWRTAVGVRAIYTEIDVGNLPWSPFIADLSPFDVGMQSAAAFLDKYVDALRRSDTAYLERIHEPEIRNLGVSLGLARERVVAGLVRKIERAAAGIEQLPVGQLSLRSELGGRILRIEGNDAAPLIQTGQSGNLLVSGLSLVRAIDGPAVLA